MDRSYTVGFGGQIWSSGPGPPLGAEQTQKLCTVCIRLPLGGGQANWCIQDNLKFASRRLRNKQCDKEVPKIVRLGPLLNTTKSTKSNSRDVKKTSDTRI